VKIKSIGLCDKLKLMTGLRPLPIYKKLFDIGIPKLEKKLDLVNLLKRVESKENLIDLDDNSLQTKIVKFTKTIIS
jgi:hypothetical protein